MNNVAALVAKLEGDAERKHLGFSADILEANALLHNPAAFEDEMGECLSKWCLNRQPCQFGRVAAREGRIHFCVLNETALLQWSDEEIAAKIAEDKRLWKQRAAFDKERAAHSFVLAMASSKVAYAAPDGNLQALAQRLLELAGWGNARQGARKLNSTSGDYLYLPHPSEGQFYGFRFNVDFFACAGDRRWWHDHRFPGGIAFTANSTGHMRFFREWYAKGNESRKEWTVKQAMLTIQNAAPTMQLSDPPACGSTTPNALAEGRATWLRQLDPTGKPLVAEVKCPLSHVPSSLQGKDWTRYEGLLHTDHAVRSEFFENRKRPTTSARPYLMDFTYLYNESQPDFIEFTHGKVFSPEEVFAEIGRPEEWTHRKAGPRSLARPDEVAAVVVQQLEICRKWTPSPWFASIDE